MADDSGVGAHLKRRSVVSLRFAAKLLLPVAVLAGSYAGFAYLKATKPEPPRRPPSEQTFAVNAVPVVFSRYQPDLTLYGETVAGRTLEIRALVTGEVVSVGDALREGGEADMGDTLVAIDPFTYQGAVTEARAQLAEAMARLTELQVSLRQETDALKRDREQLAIAKRDYERAERLTSRGTVSKKTADDRRVVFSQRLSSVEQRQNNLDVWKAKIAQQEAALERLQWRVAQAERQLEQTTLKAPFDAYVSDVGAQVGRVLGLNDRVATLRDRNDIEARFNLSDSQYGRILRATGTLVARPARVIWRIGGEPVVYDAEVRRIGATIAAQSGGVTVYARIAQSGARIALRPGAFVEVQIADREYEHVARLPQTAVYGGNTVYVVVDGRISPRKVDVVGRTGDDALVRGSIAEGEQVMTTRLSAPGDGVKVEVRANAPQETAEQRS